MHFGHMFDEGYGEFMCESVLVLLINMVDHVEDFPWVPVSKTLRCFGACFLSFLYKGKRSEYAGKLLNLSKLEMHESELRILSNVVNLQFSRFSGKIFCVKFHSDRTILGSCSNIFKLQCSRLESIISFLFNREIFIETQRIKMWKYELFFCIETIFTK